MKKEVMMKIWHYGVIIAGALAILLFLFSSPYVKEEDVNIFGKAITYDQVAYCGDHSCITPEDMLNCPLDCSMPTHTYFVSTDGNDFGQGTIGDPFETVEAARSAIRVLKDNNQFTGAIDVFLREGVYEISEPITLDQRDSGEPGKPIIYRSYPGEKATIIGSEDLSVSWQQYSGNIYMADVSGWIALHGDFNTLFIDGERAIRARTPNIGEYFQIDRGSSCVSPADVNPNFAFYFFEGDLNPSWSNLQDIELIAYKAWQASRHKIESIDGVNNIVYHVGKTKRGYCEWAGGRYYVENLLEGLDSEGEWYLDKNTQIVYYWPKAGEDIHSLRFQIPKPISLLEVEAQQEVLDLGRQFTISHWVKTTDDSNLIYTVGNAFSAKGIRFGISEGQVAFQIGDGYSDLQGNSYTSRSTCSGGAGPLNDGNWHLISAVFDLDAQTAKCFVDDYFQSATFELPRQYDDIGDTFLEIGNPPHGYEGGVDGIFANQFVGEIDDLRIYSTTLNALQISNIYNKNPSSDNLLFHLDFENLNNVVDNSVNGYEMVAYGDRIQSQGPTSLGNAFVVNSENDNIVIEPEWIHNVHVAGISFGQTEWTMPEGGYRGSQAGSRVHDPPAVKYSFTKDSSFINNDISLTGAWAFKGDHNHDLLISRNYFNHIGGGGIRLGGEATIDEEMSHDCSMIHNRITNLGEVYKDIAVIWTGLNYNMDASHNYAAYCSNAGISMGWKWDPYPSACRDNTMSYNHIHHIKMELQDGGPLYTLGAQPGTVIENNLVHDCTFTSHHTEFVGLKGIYLDQGSKDILVQNNVVYNIGGGALNVNGAYDNIITNNIFVDGGLVNADFGVNAEMYFPGHGDGGYPGGNELTRNIFYFGPDNDYYTLGKPQQYYPSQSGFMYYVYNNDDLKDIMGPGNYLTSISNSDYNLFYSVHNAYRFRVVEPILDFGVWQSQSSFDLNSLTDQDPLFVDYEGRDFTLQPSSPAFDLGFQQIDISEVGPLGVECWDDDDCVARCVQRICSNVEECGNNICEGNEVQTCPEDCPLEPIVVPGQLSLSSSIIEEGTPSVNVNMPAQAGEFIGLYRNIYLDDVVVAGAMTNDFIGMSDTYTVLVEGAYGDAVGILDTLNLAPGSYEVGVLAYRYDFDIGDWDRTQYFYYPTTLEVTEDLVCTPNTLRCNGLDVEQCTPEGDAWAFVETCDTACSGGVCEDSVCEENELRCNGLDVERCQNDNWVFIETCVTACSGGVCEDSVCEENELRCNGLDVEQCQNNDWAFVETCDTGCDQGICITCATPTQCGTGEFADMLYKCEGDTYVEYDWCLSGCVDGACNPNCVEGEFLCHYQEDYNEGGTLRLRCDEIEAWNYYDQCASGCNTANNQCNSPCSEGSYRCSPSDENFRQVCNGDGGYVDLDYCPNGCVSGSCVGSCIQGERSCVGSNVLECNAMNAYDLVEECEYACVDGACTGICVPGRQTCNGDVLMTCDSSGQYVEEQDCANTGQICKNLQCVDQYYDPQIDTSRDGETQVLTMEVDDSVYGLIDRHYRIHLPSGYTSAQNYPLYFAFHGRSGTATNTEEYTGMSDEADEKGFIVVYPQALGDSGGGETYILPGMEGLRQGGSILSTGWNMEISSLVTYYGGYFKIDDKQFMIELFEKLVDELSIDTSNVVMSGVSNGGGFVQYLSAVDKTGEFSHVFHQGFRGAGLCSTGIWGIRQPEILQQLPIMIFRGSWDPITPYLGELNQNGKYRLPAELMIETLAGVNDCDPEPVRVYRYIPTDDLHVFRWEYQNCVEPIEFYKIIHGRHKWYDYWQTDLFLDFVGIT